MNENPYLNENDRSGASGISGFMLGAIVGAGVALLFAPAAGNDTRRKLGETAKRLGSAARDKMEEGRDKLREGTDKIREGADKLQERFQGERQGFESGRREAVPSTGSTTNPGQTGRTGTTPTPGRSNP